jgi:ketosteroid isomerase-like protein
MRRILYALSTVLVSITLVGAVWRPEAIAADDGFQAFLRQFEEGNTQFLNGDAARWKSHVSRADDATIMGGFGGWEQGGTAVNQRYDWAVTRFRPSGATLDVTYLAREARGDLAYTVTLERSTVRLIDRDAPRAMALRVTTVFRKEAGAWKLIHRHEDPLMAKTAPAAVIEKEPREY